MSDDLVKRLREPYEQRQSRHLVEEYQAAVRIEELEAKLAKAVEADSRAHAMVAAALMEAATLAMRWVHPQSRSDRLRDAILALITHDHANALDKQIAEAEIRGMERAAGMLERESSVYRENGMPDAFEALLIEAAAIRTEMNGGDDD